MELNLTPRSIVKSKGTHIISLPMIWVKNAGLKPGDKLAIRIDENQNLVISAPKGAP